MSKYRIALPIVLVLWSLLGCASYKDRSALDSAKLAYLDGALAYNVACDTIVDLREMRRISDPQWARFKEAQAVVRSNAPLVRAGLDLWERTGTKPDSLDTALTVLTAAFSEVAAVKTEAQ